MTPTLDISTGPEVALARGSLLGRAAPDTRLGPNATDLTPQGVHCFADHLSQLMMNKPTPAMAASKMDEPWAETRADTTVNVDAEPHVHADGEQAVETDPDMSVQMADIKSIDLTGSLGAKAPEAPQIDQLHSIEPNLPAIAAFSKPTDTSQQTVLAAPSSAQNHVFQAVLPHQHTDLAALSAFRTAQPLPKKALHEQPTTLKLTAPVERSTQQNLPMSSATSDTSAPQVSARMPLSQNAAESQIPGNMSSATVRLSKPSEGINQPSQFSKPSLESEASKAAMPDRIVHPQRSQTPQKYPRDPFAKSGDSLPLQIELSVAETEEFRLAVGQTQSVITTANTPVATVATNLPLPPQVTLAQVQHNAQVIAETAVTLKDSGGRIDVTLTPEDLGKLSVKVEQSAGHSMVTLTAERADTQDILRRHIDLLERQLQAMGFDNMTFQFADGDQKQTGSQTTNIPDGAISSLDIEPISTQPLTPALSTQGGVDIRI